MSEFEDIRVWHELSPGGFMIMPPQEVTVKITALEGGGCRIEAMPEPEGLSDDEAREYTADQIMEAIAAAVKAHDFKAVTSLIRLLAVKDPHAAELVYESIKAGLAIRRESAAREGPPDPDVTERRRQFRASLRAPQG